MALGGLILFDLFVRAQDMRAFYTDFGSMPRSFLFDKVADRWFISLHAANGTLSFEAALFCLAALSALMLLIGFRTRFFAIVSWFFLISILNRNPMIINSGSIYFRMLLFWGMFLPLGAVWSVDSILDPSKRPQEKKTVSAATLAVWIQVLIVYWFSVAYKYQPEWRTDGTALYYALNVDQMTKPFGHFLLNYPQLLKMLTFGTYWFEVIAPALLFAPFLFFLPVAWTRTLAVFAVIGFHAGLSLALEVGLFAGICMAAVLPYLPEEFWDAVSNFALFKRLSAGLSAAAERVLAVSRSVGSWHQKTRVGSYAANGVAAFFLVYILLWNLAGISGHRLIPPQIRFIGPLFRVDQIWEMFRNAIKNDGWYVVPGTLKDGTEVDVRTGGPVHWEKPTTGHLMYKNEFWQKYMMNLLRGDIDPDYRLNLGRSYCREWHRTHRQMEKRLETFDIYFMVEETLPNGVAEPKKIHLWNHYCFDPPKAK